MTEEGKLSEQEMIDKLEAAKAAMWRHMRANPKDVNCANLNAAGVFINEVESSLKTDSAAMAALKKEIEATADKYIDQLSNHLVSSHGCRHTVIVGGFVKERFHTSVDKLIEAKTGSEKA